MARVNATTGEADHATVMTERNRIGQCDSGESGIRSRQCDMTVVWTEQRGSCSATGVTTRRMGACRERRHHNAPASCVTEVQVRQVVWFGLMQELVKGVERKWV